MHGFSGKKKKSHIRINSIFVLLQVDKIVYFITFTLVLYTHFLYKNKGFFLR